MFLQKSFGVLLALGLYAVDVHAHGNRISTPFNRQACHEIRANLGVQMRGGITIITTRR
jgi:hypothetical protein